MAAAAISGKGKVTSGTPVLGRNRWERLIVYSHGRKVEVTVVFCIASARLFHQKQVSSAIPVSVLVPQNDPKAQHGSYGNNYQESGHSNFLNHGIWLIWRCT
jgi:hypothetical protein